MKSLLLTLIICLVGCERFSSDDNEERSSFQQLDTDTTSVSNNKYLKKDNQ